MTKLPSPTAAVTVTVILIAIFSGQTQALGSGSTLAVSYSSGAVCAILAEQPTHQIRCFRNAQILYIEPFVSFSSISGGRNSFCGLRSGGFSLLCWDFDSLTSTFLHKRLYSSYTILLENLSVGDEQICATAVGAGNVTCWRTGNAAVQFSSDQFDSISSGFGFSCGILKDRSVRCWGRNSSIAKEIQDGFFNVSMATIVAGGFHVCGLNISGGLVCRGNNDSGQLDFPSNMSMEFSELALGERFSCGILQLNRSVVCWGGAGEFSSNLTGETSFELLSAGSDFICGLTTRNFSVLCWGPGWVNQNISGSSSSMELPFPKILPGPCVQSSCDCGVYPLSQTLCSGSGNVCSRCLKTPSSSSSPPPLETPPSAPSAPSAAPSKALTRGLLAFAIVGSAGAFAGICTVIYCLWTGVCFGHKKIHNSVQPTITRASSNGGTTSNSPPSITATIKRQGSRIMRRQRSGTSSKHADRAEEFTLAELAAATNNFSPENKIGAGSFGVVYRGKLSDGREVAIKRGETGLKKKKYQEKESAFDSEIAFLSRLHHKHLVKLVGFCDEKDERLLVYDYMKNGALYDHLHNNNNNNESSSNVVNSWKMRIKIALDAARGIEYLHNYAVPPIIHRDIKSSNILLDSNWTARVSDFGLSLMSPGSDRDFRPTKAAGTVGYIDPEYYGLNVLTDKSDVYGLGVVLLELLTGKRAIFKDDENGGSPASVVDYAVPAIMAGELGRVLDRRIGAAAVNEAEAVELVGYTAMHCVSMEGKDRPTMTDIVANLERALALCDYSHGSISSGGISIVSE